MAPTKTAIEERLRRLESVHRVGVALAAEHSREKLLESILLEAKNLCHADGGTLYLRGESGGRDVLRFEMVRNDSLGLALGGTTGGPITLPPVPMVDESGAPNEKNVASYAAVTGQAVNVADAYSDGDEFDFSGVRRFDEANGYRSSSFLTIPLRGNHGEVIGVLQLINARDGEAGGVRPFGAEDQETVEALAAQAGITLDNQLLLDGQKELLESFIKVIAEAIDAKSPYTGGHCERVPELTAMLTRAVCDAQEGPFAGFDLDDDGWYELRIAAWLHDCGKVVTPVHVMDKATKLEAIFDRIAVVRERFAVLRLQTELDHVRSHGPGGAPSALADKLADLDDDLAFLEKVNVGGEFLRDEDKARIHRIATRPYRDGQPLLEAEEVANLVISRGTLTEAERRTINGHMVQTIQMLEALPFPRNLAKVPEYAAGHHEKMDGTGYPRGIYGGDMSIPARVLAIADVFEALTAQDRPYKPGKKLSEAMGIMGTMKRDNHLDPNLFDLFVQSGVYRAYAERFLPPDLIDHVDERALLAIQPKGFTLPPEAERRHRRFSLRPEYEPLRRPLSLPSTK